MDNIVIAILAKDKAYCLDLYLKCIYNQTYPKNKIHLYIRTNDNTDNTESILKQFVDTHANEYASIHFDSSSISNNLKQFKEHEWNPVRFSILGKIRQDSIMYAEEKKSHYFVADCDNFIVPSTLQKLFDIKEIGVVSPMLKSITAYSNYHYDCDINGYYKHHDNYYKVLNNDTTGIISVKVVHCSYFIHNKFCKYVCYDDNSKRYEYVIFSDGLRNNKIEQYIDNRMFYGFLVICNEDYLKSENYEEEITTKWSDSLTKYF
jgi:hypothetical protein